MLQLVIFDCDGVLIDSEQVVNQVIAARLSAQGWAMSAAESEARFVGLSLCDVREQAEARLGTLPADWVPVLAADILAALDRGVPTMPGAAEMLSRLRALGVPFRVASNSSRTELALKFARTGLDRLVPLSRVHSITDMLETGRQGKPAPDLYLAAAAAEHVPPGDCIVVEDSVPGVRAAAAAGMRCLGLARGMRDGAALQEAGAALIHELHDLPDLFASLQRDLTVGLRSRRAA